MRRAAALTTVALAVMAGGCMNMYVRAPWTDARIRRTYQSTADMSSLSMVVMFPQMMMSVADRPSFMAENLFTVPVGCVFMCETALEAYNAVVVTLGGSAAAALPTNGAVSST